MKKVLTVLAIVFAWFFLINNQILPSSEFEAVTDKEVFNLKNSGLAALKPELKILMPVFI